jgi:F0F1-type ATP synthase delta subunit
MNYSSKNYADAFCLAVLAVKTDEARDNCIKNFLDLLRKNRDHRKMNEIFSLAEKIISQKTGARKVVVESGRPLSAQNKKLIEGMIKPGDYVEKKINKDLVAGIKVTINDELQLDGSFSKKIKNIFI